MFEVHGWCDVTAAPLWRIFCIFKHYYAESDFLNNSYQWKSPLNTQENLFQEIKKRWKMLKTFLAFRRRYYGRSHALQRAVINACKWPPANNMLLVIGLFKSLVFSRLPCWVFRPCQTLMVFESSFWFWLIRQIRG